MSHPLLKRRDCMAFSLGAALCPTSLWANKVVDAPSSGRRVALVIGNANYAKQALRHAISDARAVADKLTHLGYELITLDNATFADMLTSFKRFWLQSREADARVIFFAGHGVVHEGRNHLLPVDAAIDSAADVARMAFDLDEILNKLAQAQRGVNVVILDACRTSLSSKSGSRGIRTGLEQVVPPRGTLVAYSTAPGAVAYDGKNGHSPYSRRLIQQLQVPGQPIEQMFKRVREAVANDTDNQQIPWENSSLTGDFCFRNGATGRCPQS